MNDLNNYLNVMVGDCRDTLQRLPANSVQMVCTSPPYWGLRRYLPDGHEQKHLEIGAEASPQAFVQTLVGVFAEVWRVLNDDGVCFVNLADSYCGSTSETISARASSPLAKGTVTSQEQQAGRGDRTRELLRSGVKPKDMCLIPQRFVIAMQEAGWYVRDQIAWVKKAPMPESVRDRFTKSWEPIFMFTKSAKYYFDVDAVKEPATFAGDNRGLRTDNRRGTECNSVSGMTGNFRQMRNAWILSPEPTSDAHFATFPTAIPRRCILATTQPGDTVLDCFGGSGTVAEVAIELGRKAILCELNANYVKLIERRATTTIGFDFTGAQK